MNSSDFRLVKLLPVTRDGSFSRASDGTFFDRAGVLQTAPPNALRVTYDPTDLGKAPYVLIEPEATNVIRNNTMAGAVIGTIGLGGAIPTNWQMDMTPAQRVEVLDVRRGDAIDYIDLRFHSANSDRAYLAIYPEPTNGTGVTASIAANQKWVFSQFIKHVGGVLPANVQMTIQAMNSAGSVIGDSASGPMAVADHATPLAIARMTVEMPATPANTSKLTCFIIAFVTVGQPYDFTIRIGLPQLERDRLSSVIRTNAGTYTRAADLVGTGAGLLYSSVPITEPLWAAGTTFAAKALVRDAANIVYESLVANNVGNDPTLPVNGSKWLKLGVTNRWKVFDKAVNSQTIGQGPLIFGVKPGALANTLMLLNVEGTSVTVREAESGYARTRQLVRHDVLDWYDFYFQEPIRDGDVVFDDLPPHPNALVTVMVDNGLSDARMGCCLIGKYRTIGKTSSSMTGGVLSYSTSTTDTFGNVTMVRRNNAKRQNFDVHIPPGLEDETYRLLMQYTDVELGVIASDRYSMGIGYGFLGQWSVPISRGGKTASIELKGLV